MQRAKEDEEESLQLSMGKPGRLDKKKGQALGSNVSTGSPDGQCPGEWISLE